MNAVTPMVTMDGMEDGRLACPSINIWKNWADRSQGIAGKVRHGDQVTLLEQRGKRCKVLLPSGETGFVTYWFIRELKGNV